ncbi:hypothetical protein PJ985_12250 [Streptomyces sp. ACA25]|uniref:hypothetical protein n=1 Tax=Streptomyces sp. ACA25 TaxID=3022596 RepID=UPI0023075EA8|nr:hypothetical protein [Streptomyces sp. ACA25]MDB1088337.1 hypothetical protein [Streptomyces sp. ACA25]
MNRRFGVTWTVAVVTATLVVISGCAKASNADPETKTFEFSGDTLNVKANDVPTDLATSDRSDVEVTRWFSTGAGASGANATWTLSDDGTLHLTAECSGLANCDAKFRVEVPQHVKVLRDGRETDLKGDG